MKKLLITVVTLTLILSACDEKSQDNEKKGASQIATSSTEPKNNSSTKNKEQNTSQQENQGKTTSNENQVKNETNKNESQVNVNTNKEDFIYQFTQEQKSAMEDEFLRWADERAKVAGLAVSNYYFNHGAGGHGDWFASSEDGDIQVQNFNNPGPTGFKIRGIGGVVFYTSKSGETGITKELKDAFTAEGYSRHADLSKNINKYILADNGKVYELIKSAKEMCFSCGFGEYSDSGTREDGFGGEDQFKVSQDIDAQKKWQEILEKYKTNAVKISAQPKQGKTSLDSEYAFINEDNEIDYSNPAFRDYYFFAARHQELFGVHIGMNERQVKDILGAPTGETVLSGQGGVSAKLYGDIAVAYSSSLVQTITIQPQKAISEQEALRYFPDPTLNNLERIRNGEAKYGPERYPFMLYDSNHGNGYQIVVDFDDVGKVKEIRNQEEIINP
ncbi:hypothetical protein J9174_02400 [Macrococcoides canis]|uniref:hypothetical protein n=1 Tax=Macrococcoides canis TaxID=1855823 RepID=UPI001AEC182E|nr:hypothetical protein [Macrococcus canis]QTQ08548.1 hypothetical protein J9174_02400 [Macrococcus canis]